MSKSPVTILLNSCGLYPTFLMTTFIVLFPIVSAYVKSPDPFVLAEILGKEETTNRLNYAIEKINQKL